MLKCCLQKQWFVYKIHGKEDINSQTCMTANMWEQRTVQLMNERVSLKFPTGSILSTFIYTFRLTSETDIKSYQQKLREIEKANDDLQSKLAKKEREAEARSQEKVILQPVFSSSPSGQRFHLLLWAEEQATLVQSVVLSLILVN